MPKMKNSGIEWIGEIPKEWDVIRIKDKYTFDTGFTPDTKHSEYYTDEYGFEWATITDVKNGRVASPTKSTISREYVKNNHKKQMPIGCLLYSFKLSVGETAITDRPLFTNEAIACFYPSKDVNINFFKYSSFLIEHNANTNIYGAKILNQQLINNAYVVFPPLEMQKSIANFLDQKCFEIDSLSSDIEKQIEVLKEYKKSIITKAVTKGLNPNMEMKDSGIDWIGMMPKHWKIKRTKYIANSLSKGNGITKDQVFDDGDIQCVRYGEIYSKYEQSFDKTSSLTKLNQITSPKYIQYGDILFAGTGELIEEIGKNVVFLGNEPCLAGGDIVVLKHSQNPRFLNYALNSTYSQEQKSKGKAKLKVVHISATDIGNILITLPPIEEQNEIAEFLDKTCNDIDMSIADKKAQLETLAEYKKSLIYKYVTGKKEVKC